MKAKNIINNKYIKGSLLIVAGILLGWLFFHSPKHTENSTDVEIHEHSEKEHTIWTCSMHPQIRMDKPGDCPICGMDLIPLISADAEIDDQAIQMSESAMKLAEVQTSIVSKGATSKDILLYGKIQVDERLQQSQTAHVPGRIEQLLINVTGEQVQKGQLIAKIYSPELVTAQKELIEALSLKDKYPAMVEASREKLRNWKLSEQQISDIEKSGNLTSTFDIFANTSGMVSNRKVNEGDYISKGAVLFDVVGLSKVWAVFDAYESDLPWISMNQTVDFATQAIPGKIFSGKISFIDPVVDPTTRIVRVRIELGNPGLALKPDMFINGTIHSTINGKGEQLTIPQSAVLWTGTRSVVYVKVPDGEKPTFKMREVTLGASTNENYVVTDGLQEGEEIVTNGTFSVDAAAQLAGKTSMMNPVEISAPADENMEMNKTEETVKREKVNPEFQDQLTKVYSAYLKMKNAFVATDTKKAGEEAKKVEESLKSVDMKLLTDETHMAWMEQLKTLASSIKTIGTSTEIAQQRLAFSNFNDTFYKSLKMFGLKNDSTYYQFCPMANDDKGAYWLSETQDIRNPYFGDEMLECGETKETIK